MLVINLRRLVASKFTCLTVPFIGGKKGNKKKRKECTLLTKAVLLQMTRTLHSFLISSKTPKGGKIILGISNEITDNEDEIVIKFPGAVLVPILSLILPP